MKLGEILTETAREEEDWEIGKGDSSYQKYGDYPGKFEFRHNISCIIIFVISVVK